MKSFTSLYRTVINNNPLQRISQPTKTIVDNRPTTIAQRKLQEKINATSLNHTIQRQPQVAQLGKDDKGTSGLVQDSVDAYNSITGSQVGPLQGNRAELDTELRKHEHKNFFPAMLDFVNKGLGVNTEANLPSDKKDKYISDTREVQEGTMSNTRAFGRSVVDWTERGNYPGAGLNMLGMIPAFIVDSAIAMKDGVEDDIKRKTGQQ